jgi:hypothetical protein
MVKLEANSKISQSLFELNLWLVSPAEALLFRPLVVCEPLDVFDEFIVLESHVILLKLYA